MAGNTSEIVVSLNVDAFKEICFISCATENCIYNNSEFCDIKRIRIINGICACYEEKINDDKD